MIDTGDTVHVPSVDEEWLVAYVEGGYVTCCGWPESRIAVADCVLVKSATEDERRSLLMDMAQSSGSRAAYAKRRLVAPTPAPGGRE